MKATIKDIARLCGVNVSTVSRSLTGSYGVHEETRRKVEEAAARLNYRPNRVARAMATGRSHTLAIVVSDIRNPFFAEVARGAEDAAHAAGCDLILCNTDLNASKQMSYLRTLMEKRVDGIVVNSVSPLSEGDRVELLGYGIPVVLLNPVAGSAGFSSVTADNGEGGALAARHLMSLGHRTIVHITGKNQQGNLNNRTQGFLRALAAAGLGKPVVLRGEHSTESAYQMVRRIFAPGGEGRTATALFAANDAMAFGAIRALQELRIGIPKDVSLMGFDNVELGAIVQPPLTTIHQPKCEMGRAAIEMLMARGRTPQAAERRTLGVHLVERESCRKV
jgi:LacI family transcriptional regulator